MFPVRLIQAVFFNGFFFALVIFPAAGTWEWWRGWVLVAVTAGAAAVSMLTVFRKNEDLLKERMRPPIQKGQPLSDKILVLLFLVAFVGVILLAPMDAMRFHWRPPPSPGVAAVGLLLVIAGWTMITMTFHANSFAAPVVKFQEERGQYVIETGIYRFVRHPMYAGCIPLLLGMALWLGSWIAALSAIVPAVILAIRCVYEERFLREHLTGYEEYARKVRYRLIPFVW